MTDPSPATSKPLLLSRRFAPLFWCQFFSAFSDNFLKNALAFLIVFHIGGSLAEPLTQLAAAVFIAPYFILSAFGGQMADRYDKAIIAQRLKLAEIAVSVIAIAGFAVHSVPVLFVALFGFGVIGSLFGPIKYGILPDLLDKSELPAANALVEGATFMAILLGTIVGGLAAKDGGDPASFSGLMLVFALLCWGASLLIPKVGSGAPDLVISTNIVRSTGELIRHLRSDRRLWWGALVTSWFWLIGAVVLSLLPPLVKNVHRRQRERRHHVSRGVLDRRRDRLGPRGVALLRPHRGAADARWRGRALPVRHRSRLGDLRPAGQARAGRHPRDVRDRARPPHGDRSRRPRHLRRPLHRADLRSRPGLGRRRPSRPRDRRRQRAQRRLHGRRHHRRRGAATGARRFPRPASAS